MLGRLCEPDGPEAHPRKAIQGFGARRSGQAVPEGVVCTVWALMLWGAGGSWENLRSGFPLTRLSLNRWRGLA